ncbi:ATP-binding cassette domain-containing protein [Streptomyces sp. NPDC006700]|uniref:ATP-binding cassette domain-containing protein n=1 Tax=Streptomyces sp. NPDC006700 TaxID=3154479 RepID=UPI0033CC7DF1
MGVYGLLGPNGAGKTTLLRTLATVAPPQEGTLDVCGRKVHSERTARAVRPMIGYLPQEFGYYPSFSVYDFVRYSAWLRGVPDREAVRAGVGMEIFLDPSPGHPVPSDVLAGRRPGAVPVVGLDGSTRILAPLLGDRNGQPACGWGRDGADSVARYSAAARISAEQLAGKETTCGATCHRLDV